MLSENIKEYRKQKGYTQETLAQALNIVRQTVSKWEKGYSVPDADMLEKLAEVLDVSVSDLLGSASDDQKQTSDLERISSQLAMLNDQIARETARRKRSRLIKTIVMAVVLAVVAIVLFWTFPRVSAMSAGYTDNVEVRQVASSLYSKDDIDAAIEVVKDDFEKDFRGCELTLIYFAGDERCKRESKESGVDTLVLLSTFKTGTELPGDVSFNSDQTYEGWSWILDRSEDGTWKLITYGYG